MVASPSTACTAPFGGSPSSARISVARPRRLIASSQRFARVEALARRAGEQQRHGDRRRDVHLRTHRAHLADQAHHPVEFGPRLRRALHRHRLRPGGADQAALRAVAHAVPQLLGDEGHHRVQQAQDGAEHVLRGALHLLLLRPVRAVQHRLGEFQEPVAEGVPGEAVAGASRSRRSGRPPARHSPPPPRRSHRGSSATAAASPKRRVEIAARRDPVHLAEARGVPDLGGEGAIALDPLLRELDVAPRPGQRAQREAHRIRAMRVDQVQRVEHVALRLRHLLALLVAHQAVDADGAERHLPHEVDAHHHHPGDPEEDDVEAGHQHVAGVVLRQFRRLLRPAERAERPQRGAEPGVQHVLVARQLDIRGRTSPAPARAPPPRWATKTSPSGAYQAGIWCPHQSWRETHQGWMSRIQAKKVFSHCLGVNTVCPVSTAGSPGGQRLGVHVPLHGQPRLDRHAGAVAMRHRMGVRLDLLDELHLLEPRHDRLARHEAVLPRQAAHEVEVRHALHGREGRRDLLEHHAPLGIQHRGHRQRMPPADLEIVEVMRGRDLHRARALLRVGILVRHHRDGAAGQRQDHALADQVGEARILGMHRDRRVAQHRLGPRGGHHQETARLALHRVAEVPQMALHLLALDLEVGDRGQELRVPVHQAPVAVEQPLPIQRTKTSRTASDRPSSMVKRSRGQSSWRPAGATAA
jgi:hypothetical protein